MKFNGTIQHPEDSLAFMRCLTFIGGFLNAYSYFTRGGVFVTFHTGNLVRTGLSIVEKNPTQFWSSLTPIIAGFIGATIALLLKNKIVSENNFHKKIILIEIITLFTIGFMWSGVFNGVINFILSMLAMLQLSSFRKVKGIVHNSTIMTGNLRTTAQYFTLVLVNRDRKSISEFISYFINFLSFPLGVIVGGVLCIFVGNFAVWLCALILLILFLNLNNVKE